MFLLSLNLSHAFFQLQRYNRPWHFVTDIRTSVFSKIREYGELLLYSSLFLGSAAMGMAYTSCYIQGISCTSHIALVMFLVVFSVYNLNRKTDEAEDALNHERRFRITKKFERHFFIAALAAYLIALAVAAFHGIAAFCVVIDPAHQRHILQRSRYSPNAADTVA